MWFPPHVSFTQHLIKINFSWRSQLCFSSSILNFLAMLFSPHRLKIQLRGGKLRNPNVVPEGTSLTNMTGAAVHLCQPRQRIWRRPPLNNVRQFCITNCTCNCLEIQHFSERVVSEQIGVMEASNMRRTSSLYVKRSHFNVQRFFLRTTREKF